MAEAAEIVRVDGLKKAFDDFQVLKGIDLTIAEGDLVSIIGPSGCGKSTLLRCLNMIETFDEGRVTIAGVTIERGGPRGLSGRALDHRSHELRREVGMVFQGFNLFPNKTLIENVMLAPMVVKKTGRDEARAIAEKLIAKVGLSKQLDRHPANLSGGQQQRGAIARALAMNPKVMLYDEPTSALDPELVDEVLDVMKTLDREGMTQIVVTHEMRFARNASDYIVYMEAGEVVEVSDEDEIFENPKDPRTRRFLKRFA